MHLSSSSMLSRKVIFFSLIIFMFILAQLIMYKQIKWKTDFNNIKKTIELSSKESFFELTSLCDKLSIKLYLLDVNGLEEYDENLDTNVVDNLIDQKFISLGMDIKHLHFFQTQVDPVLQIQGIDLVYIKNIMPKELVKPLFKNKVISIFLKKDDILFHIYVLHSREGFWWIGNVNSDPQFGHHVDTLGFNLINPHLDKLNKERALEKFLSYESFVIPGLYIPNDIPHFVNDFQTSEYHECPISRSRAFNKEHRYITSQAFRFMHKSYKLLSRVASLLFKMKIPFFLTSGTLLGYYRECNIIPYSSDVDIGVFSQHYTPQFVSILQQNNFTLKHQFGLPNDSLEYSFTVPAIPDVKLDVFYFYDSNNTIWNGATHPESRKRYRFIFPKFNLCWTEFISLKVRIPCETEKYLEANYGPNWNIPQEYWDWKNSPYNVEYIGEWPKESASETIQIFR